jgi:hypothetical protein
MGPFDGRRGRSLTGRQGINPSCNRLVADGENVQRNGTGTYPFDGRRRTVATGTERSPTSSIHQLRVQVFSLALTQTSRTPKYQLRLYHGSTAIQNT